jgi:hypothetical protein
MNHPNAIIKKLKLDKAKAPLIVNAPSEFLKILTGISFDEKIKPSKWGAYDYVQIFARSQAEMEKTVQQVVKAGVTDSYFWACYPKKSSALYSDMQRETVWTALALIQLEAVSIIALDENWSALRARPIASVGHPKK